MILGKTYLKGIENKLYLGNVLIYDPTITALKPIMTNFRVEAGQPSRIYFDAPLGSVDGIDYTKFTISGAAITSVDTTNNYFTISSSFNFWKQAITIRQENGNGTVYDFKMESVYNNIVEPDATINRYVEIGASGSGLSGDPMSITAAFSEASANTTYWIKKGDYSGIKLTVGGSGQLSAPVKFIGYDTTPGDNPTQTRTPGMTFNPNVMPVITDSGSGVTVSLVSRDYIIIKNMQVIGSGTTSNDHIINLDEGSNHFLENVYVSGAWTGYNSTFALTSINQTLKNCYNTDQAGFGVNLAGIGHLVDDHYSCCSYNVGMDYQITMNGSGVTNSGQHIVRNSYIERSLDQASHTGHGLTFYAVGSLENNYSLAENLEIVNVRQAIENRGHGVLNCVYRGIECHQTANDPTYGSSIIIAMTTTSARYGWFERINAHGYTGGNGIERAIRFLSSGDDQTAVDNGRYNTFVNCVFDKVTYGIVTAAQGEGGAGEVPFDNTIINCTFNDITRMFYAENPDNGTGNKLVNCIIQNAPSKFADNGNTSAWTFENCLFWNSWTTGEGTGSININPDLNAEYQPQASFAAIQVPQYLGVYYDEKEVERQDQTTPGAISSSEETPSTPTDELVKNGDFSQGATYWNIGGGTSAISGGEATVASTGGAYAVLSQDNVMIIGQSYTVKYDVISTNGENLYTDLDEISWETDTIGSKTQVITSPDTTLLFKRRVGATTTDVTLDNISVKLN